jgi:putative DNA primase/helicase
VYENIRKSVARMLNWRAKTLDGDWGKRRGRRAQSGEDDPVTKRIEPWHEPVTDLAGVLDAAVAQLERFLIVPSSTYLDTIALWVAHTYLLLNEAFGVGFTPLLAFQSPLKRCGKSTALKCVHLMSYAAHMVSSITPSSLFRVVDEYGVTLTVDEADNALRDEKSDLLGIMNAGRDRMTARVMRAEPVGNGASSTLSRLLRCPRSSSCPTRFRIAPSCCRSSARHTASVRSG